MLQCIQINVLHTDKEGQKPHDGVKTWRKSFDKNPTSIHNKNPEKKRPIEGYYVYL